jgi:hypothetical protein
MYYEESHDSQEVKLVTDRMEKALLDTKMVRQLAHAPAMLEAWGRTIKTNFQKRNQHLGMGVPSDEPAELTENQLLAETLTMIKGLCMSVQELQTSGKHASQAEDGKLETIKHLLIWQTMKLR